MAVDLSQLKTEILAALAEDGFATFFSDSGLSGSEVVYWDTARHPAIRDFLAVAKKTGCALIVFYERIFSQFSIDDTLERLEGSEMGREEKRSYELRLRELQKFEGFTCELEVSFTYGQNVYQYQARTDWFVEFESIFADVAVGEPDMYDEDEDDGDEGHISGYFSKN
jgi:hypothetical protein